MDDVIRYEDLQALYRELSKPVKLLPTFVPRHVYDDMVKLGMDVDQYVIID